MPPQNMPLWHIDYFEVQAAEEKQMQEGLSDGPPPRPSYLKAGHKISDEKASLPVPGREYSYHHRLGVNTKQTY